MSLQVKFTGRPGMFAESLSAWGSFQDVHLLSCSVVHGQSMGYGSSGLKSLPAMGSCLSSLALASVNFRTVYSKEPSIKIL